MLLFAPVGAVVRLNGSGLSPHRKLTQHGGDGMAFGDGGLASAEALGTFERLGDDGGRDALVRSTAAGVRGPAVSGSVAARLGLLWLAVYAR
jgi:hypothetical protein